ncbi:hypothetical protein PRK78_007013 [Emydomyces testavorans]|uniref:Conserved oligomeric Golgi complex subunit 1 n=1 Tax=Emydomyces testavorans TaxID=2070801 RepID=A0AAF0DNL8_9EURO|nr:hypothetical protein PRK78_007013 [Emydomyces testavorans]
MAADVPDTRTLKSWQEAFQYPIPTVRRIEQELRRDILSNREKLRSLVGVRYRDLLDTAQTIMEMNNEMQQVEENLSEIGRCCNPAAIARKSDGLRRLQKDKLDRVSSDRTFAAQLSLFSKCASSISKILRKRGSCIIVAKLLVISRLLHNALSQSTRATQFVECLWSQLEARQRTLLKRINRRLISSSSSVEDIIESLSAFCLVSRSSAEAALRHFHDVRLEVIGHQVEQSSSLRHALLGALSLYTHTLQRTANMLSGPLFDALKKLTMRPLLDDPAITCIGELGIDIFQPWISKEIRNFTPWIQHDQMSKQAAENVIKTWSKEAFDTLIAVAKTQLSRCEDFREVVSVRNFLLEAWLTGLNSTPCHSSMEVLEGIRSVINDRLVSILRAQSKGLTCVGIEISSTIAGWVDLQNRALPLSLWDPELVFLDFSDGALTFKTELMRRMQGHDAHILQVLDIYQNWLTTIMSRTGMIQELRAGRWEDIIDDDVDEDVLEIVKDELSEDDPHLLQTEHADALLEGFKSLQNSLNETVEGMRGPNLAPQAGFLLRIIRAIRTNIPGEVSNQDYIFAHDLVPKLHCILAEEVVSHISPSSLTRSLNPSRLRCPGRTLWEGDPQLPVQPSQAAFKLLRALVLAMEQQGPDLWDHAAVNELKLCLISRIITAITPSLEGPSVTSESDQGTTNGEHRVEDMEKDAESGATADHKTQLLFDILYLGCALTTAEGSNIEDQLKPLIDTLESDLKFVEQHMDTLRKRSQEYWKRTHLLFGLLG